MLITEKNMKTEFLEKGRHRIVKIDELDGYISRGQLPPTSYFTTESKNTMEYYGY